MTNNPSMSDWFLLSEKDRVLYLSSKEEIPKEIFVAASKDPSLVVRTTLITKLQDLAKSDHAWIKLIKILAEKDPEAIVRKAARIVLRDLFVGS